MKDEKAFQCTPVSTFRMLFLLINLILRRGLEDCLGMAEE